MKDTLLELWKFRENIFKPNFKYSVWEYSRKKTIRFGTYIKPIARIVGNVAKLFGYDIRYRTRGKRCNKYQNYNGDIKSKDAFFLCVYGNKHY